MAEAAVIDWWLRYCREIDAIAAIIHISTTFSWLYIIKKIIRNSFEAGYIDALQWIAAHPGLSCQQALSWLLDKYKREHPTSDKD